MKQGCGFMKVGFGFRREVQSLKYKVQSGV
jgi:hypothetical protein